MPSKLHLAKGPKAAPLCGRLLSGHRLQRAQDQATMLSAPWSAFEAAGAHNLQCRHCLRAAGIIPPISRRAHDPEEGEQEVSDEDLLRELDEENSDEQ